MDDSGEVWALDRTHSKVAEIMSLAASFGLTSIRALKADATRAVRGGTGVMSSAGLGEESDELRTREEDVDESDFEGE